MFQDLFLNVSDKDKTAAVDDLFTHSAPSNDFFLMVVLSVFMATLGLLTNSSAVIVGSMLIAPILYPIVGVAMGIIMSDFTLMSKSFATLLKASVLGVMVSATITVLFSSQASAMTQEILARTNPSLIHSVIGLVAGAAAAFALVKPQLNATLPGVAISVALVPPIAVVGIGLARWDMVVLFNALLYFLINAAGVVFSAAIIFSLMNFYVKRGRAQAVVKKQENQIQ